ncbi:hypothetical protein DM02DRAFT_281659 [Periconia macrospinosa]|uniref:Uncharacterized protein n=1 Tax=Periconia macrospinosa TaxID=97972 RepID=A0A2V1D540_9PLEO|nr:hypothetical protein DM02DRAFT_281659 [Periconia macrospinosa]
METLPIELGEMICSWLMPGFDNTEATKASVSSKSERVDIYHLRLTNVSRSLNVGASMAFVKIVQDIPTNCEERSLLRLSDLVALPHVGKHITCLTFNTSKLFLKQNVSEGELRHLIMTRHKWIMTHLRQALVLVLRRIPWLCCLRTVLEPPSIFKYLTYHNIESCRDGMIWASKENIWKAVTQKLADPTHYLMDAMEVTELGKTLQSLILLVPSCQQMSREAAPCEGSETAPFPSLTHITFAPSYRLISSVGFQVSSDNLTSLQIILDSKRYVNADVWTWTSSSDFPSRLRSFTVRMSGSDIQTEPLLRCISQVSSHIKLLPLLVIKDITAIDFEYATGIDSLCGDGRFKDVVFENVKYAVIYRMGFDDCDINEPTEPDRGWKAFRMLCERADRALLRTDMFERAIKKSEWEM